MADIAPGGTRNHPLLFNRDLIDQHPAEAVGVLSPYSMNHNYIGKTWTFIGNLEFADPITCIAYIGSGMAIAGADIGGGGGGFLYKSTNYGYTNTWHRITFSPAWLGNSVNTIAYLGDGIVLIATGDRHVYRSIDYGVDWIDSGLISAFTLNVLRYVGWGIVLLGDASGFVHRSKNYGQTFPFAIGLGSSVLSIEYLDDEIAVVGMANGHIWRSSNFTGLFTWSDRGDVTGSNSPINTITYLGDGVAIAGADNAHIYMTTDFGVTWADPTGAPVADSKIKTSVYVGNGVVVIGTDAGGRIWRSTDYGLIWTDLGAVTPNAFQHDTLTYLGNGIVVAGDSAGGIVRSEVAYKTDECVAQNIEKPVRTITASQTLSIGDSTIIADATGGAFTISLPSATASIGHVFNIKKVDATFNTVTIDAAGVQTIDGSFTYNLNIQYQGISIIAVNLTVAPGSAWYII